MQETVNEDQEAHLQVLAAVERERKLGLLPDPDFDRRLENHFRTLRSLFHSLYGDRNDWLDQLSALVLQCARSWQERAPQLKALDAEREEAPGWFQSNRMLGGVCYV
ncbi:MAG: amylosucrase, partial [Actinomycetes bacterium]